MYPIQNITQDPRQNFIINIPGSDPAILDLEYLSTQQGWFLTITHKTFQASKIRLCVCPNVLRQWKYILPFGFACLSNNKQDPMTIDAFTSGQSQLLFLESADVQDFEETFYGG